MLTLRSRSVSGAVRESAKRFGPLRNPRSAARLSASLVAAIGVLAFTGLVTLTPTTASAQDTAQTASAAELFRRAESLYADGAFREAGNVLRRVDVFELPGEARTRYYSLLRQVDAALAAEADVAVPVSVDGSGPVIVREEPPAEPAETRAQPEPVAEQPAGPEPVAERPAQPDPAIRSNARLEDDIEVVEIVEIEAAPAEAVSPAAELAAADAMLARGRFDDAASAYRSLADREDIDPAMRQRVDARLTQIRVRQGQGAIDVDAAIERAREAARRGDLAMASGELSAIEQSDAPRSYFDQVRINNTRAMIDEQAQAQAQAQVADIEAEPAEQTGAPAVAVVAPGGGDAQAQPVEQAATLSDPAASDDTLARARALFVEDRLAEARQQSGDGNLALAQQAVERALAVSPENAEAQALLADIQARRSQRLASVDAQGAPDQPIDRIIQDRELRRQNALAEYNEAINTANSELVEDNFASAFESAARAKLILDRNQRLLAPAEFELLYEQAETLSVDIARRQRQAEEVARLEEEQRRAREQREAELDAMLRNRIEVDRLIRQAMELRDQLRYEEAIQLLDAALFIEPNNPGAQALREIMDQNVLFRTTRDIRNEKDAEIAQQHLQNMEATIPYSDLITFPDDWPELSKRRWAAQDLTTGESEATRRVRRQLAETVPINFEQNPLVNVIDFFVNTTGVNIFVNWSSLEAAGVDQDTPITLRLNNVSAEKALELVLEQASPGDFDPIGYTVQDGIVTISTQRELAQATDIRVYDIRDILMQIRDFTEAPNFNLSDALSDLAGEGGGGSSIFDDTEEDDSDEEEEEREELLEDIQQLIRDSVGDPLEWVESGGDTSSVRELNGNLIVRTSSENHRQLDGLLGKLRETRAIQISVEARILAVEENFLERIGVDFDLMLNAQSDTLFNPASASTTFDSSTAPPALQAFGQQPRNAFSLASGTNANQRQNAATSSSFSQVPVFNNSIDMVQRSTSLTPGPFTENNAFNFGFSYLDDLQVSLFLEATQANQRSIRLDAPRITFFNGQRAYVLVATQTAFISDLEPVPNTGGFDPELGVVSSGVVLDVRGTASADRRYVTLEMRPSLATIDEIRPVEFAFVSTEGDASEASAGTIEVPTLTVTQTRSTVSVPDRGTILLGGQRIVEEIEVEAGVPVLSKVPVLNRLFTNNSTVQDERTLILLVKPTIIIASEEEELNFPGLEQGADTYPVGTDAALLR